MTYCTIDEAFGSITKISNKTKKKKNCNKNSDSYKNNKKDTNTDTQNLNNFTHFRKNIYKTVFKKFSTNITNTLN